MEKKKKRQFAVSCIFCIAKSKAITKTKKKIKCPEGQKKKKKQLLLQTEALSMTIFGKNVSSLPAQFFSCTDINTSPHFWKENLYGTALGSFPTDLCLSLGIFPNHHMAKALLFSRQHCLVLFTSIFWKHIKRISNRLDLHKNKSFQNKSRKNKNNN